MKKTIKALKIASALLLITVAFIACDKDFSTIESDIQGSQNFGTDSIEFPVLAYNKMLNPVQTNNLTSNLLGIYTDGIYGSTNASVVTQVTLSSYEPDFGDNAVIDSVMLTIPYFVDSEVVDDETEYTIDSLYGGSPVKLSIYRNNYFLRDYNPEDIDESQIYYSNGNGIDFNGTHRGELLYQNNNFYPDNQTIDIDLSEDEELITPSLYVDLNITDPATGTKHFWTDLFKLDGSSNTELSNVNNWTNYFRGLYFRTELADTYTDGHLLMLDFSQASIVVKYTYDAATEVDDDGNPARVSDEFSLVISGNKLNVLENDATNNVIATADATANTTIGDDNLYLKGGEGGMAVIDLFEGDVTVDGVDYDALEYFKGKKDSWLINEANLVFYVDQEATDELDEDQEPNRVVLYDVNNNTPIIDYFFDFTDSTNPEDSKIFHTTPLEKDSDDNGVKYKIRLTEHINSILLKDSTNLKLGLYVSANVNEVSQNSILDSDDKLTSGSVMSPKGTILHGGTQNVTDQKRVKLEIFYTEPEN